MVGLTLNVFGESYMLMWGTTRCPQRYGYVRCDSRIATVTNSLAYAYLARNNLRAMKKGDLAFFYHSNCKVPGIAGMMEIVREHSVDGLYKTRLIPFDADC